MTIPRATVLVVEDDRFQRRAAEAILRRHGFEVTTASDGEAALRAVAAAPPDLVLLDLIMPKLSGFEVLRRLKGDPATAGIPVLVLTNLGQDSDVSRAREAGADDYVVKAHTTLSALATKVEALVGRPPAAP